MTLPDVLLHTLQATGFVFGDRPAPGLDVERSSLDRRIDFDPHAIWRDRSQLEVIFKYTAEEPRPDQVASWHRDVWNLGLAPLLWVVSPQRIRIYNAYQRPANRDTADLHLLQTAETVDHELARLDDYAGRLAMTTGRFWSKEDRIRRDGRVDLQLLRDLQRLEGQLHEKGLPRDTAQALLGRSIFVRFLNDRQILGSEILQDLGIPDLRIGLGQHKQAYRLFDWLRSTFNGDLFPTNAAERSLVSDDHLTLVSETLSGVNPETGQGSLWPYRFDVIPIELISSIYEQFAHAAHNVNAQIEGIHYTPVSVVNLILDEVIDESLNDSSVLDISCGSGVFLVEAFRRLVALKARGKSPSRTLIRETLAKQIFGVDKSESAIRIASFSLYLASIELDPNPTPPEALRFDPLIGENLFVGDAFNFDSQGDGRKLHGKTFDVIVGNPPWTFAGQSATNNWTGDRDQQPVPPRSQDFSFVWRSMDFAHAATRFGVVMRATPFFSRSEVSIHARNTLLRTLSPVALVNLSDLRNDLFPTAATPAVVLLARLDPSASADMDRLTLVNVPWTARFARSGAFEVAPGDIRNTSLSQLTESPHLLKALVLGTPRDRILLQHLEESTIPLDSLLNELGTSIRSGIHAHRGDRKSAAHLHGLPFLRAGFRRYNIRSSSLPLFDLSYVHRPRNRSVFHGPLVLIGEGIRNARSTVSISEVDLVYVSSIYGISLGDIDENSLELCRRIAGILQSSLAAWHAFMTASEFGIHKRRLLVQDLNNLAVPSLDVLRSTASAPISKAMEALDSSNGSEDQLLCALDDAVFDVYELEHQERLVVQDGLDRAKHEYVSMRNRAEFPTTEEGLQSYAQTFLEVINPWQKLLGRDSLGAEILSLNTNAPLRVVRFYSGGQGCVRKTDVDTRLDEILARIGARIDLDITQKLATLRELRVHSGPDVLVIKPSAQRFWTVATGLNDADKALGDGLRAGT